MTSDETLSVMTDPAIYGSSLPGSGFGGGSEGLNPATGMPMTVGAAPRGSLKSLEYRSSVAFSGARRIIRGPLKSASPSTIDEQEYHQLEYGSRRKAVGPIKLQMWD
jgi:hypothetical protein